MIVLGGSTDVTTYFQMRLLTGGDATGLTISDFDMSYVRTRETGSAKVDAVALAAANTAHTDNRGIEVDATNAPGKYRFDWPDAAFADGTEVILTIKHTSCFTESLRVELVDYNPRDGVRLGLTALPNAAADAAGGLIISDAGGLDADDLKADVTAILEDTGTTLQGELDGIQADTEDIQTRLPAALVSGRIDASVGAMAANVMTAAAANADLTTELQSGLATDALLTTVAGYLDTEIAAIKAKTDNIPADPADASDIAALIDALPTGAENAAAVLAVAFEGAETVQDFLRLARAALYGKVSGGATTTMAFRDKADTKDRISATVDADGNRSALTLDAA